MPQALFHTGKKVLLIAGFGEEYTVRTEASLLEGRCEQVLSCHAPEHPTACSGGDAGREMSGSRAIDRAVSPTGHLMQAAQGEPATRQTPVDGRDAERQRLACPAARAFKMRDTCTKLVDSGICGLLRHLDG